MSDIVKEKPVMEEVQIKYNNFIKDRIMMNEYDKRQAYLYGNQIMLEEERRLGREEGIKEGREEGIKEGREEGIKEGREEGIKEGREEGIKENQIAIARGMKKDNIDVNSISKYTGLTIEEIENLWTNKFFIEDKEIEKL